MEWTSERIYNYPIEHLWTLFQDKNIKKIMPKVEEHVLIEKQEHEAGAKHRQSYREGKRVETYIVETLEYIDTPEYKKKKSTFVLGKAFEITLTFILEKVDENHTKLIYTSSNKGINFVGRAMLKLSTEKANLSVINEFMDRVETEAGRL